MDHGLLCACDKVEDSTVSEDIAWELYPDEVRDKDDVV